MVWRVTLIFIMFISIFFIINFIFSDLENLLLVFAIFTLISVIVVDFRIKANRKRQREYEQRLLQSGIYQVDSMSGITFEDYLATLLKAKGYGVQQTPASGDYGVDLILSSNGNKIAVQAKRYSDKVGIKAVQEISSAKNYYGVDECWVITNNYFTVPAINLADSNAVKLIDRDQLVDWILEVNNRTQIS